MKTDRPLILALVLAGALAVPLSPIGTPAAAAVMGLLTWLGLRVWRWSRLPMLISTRSSGPLTGVAFFAIGLGLGLLVLAVIRLLIEPAVGPAAGARMAAAGMLPVWRRLAIIYVACTTEELLFRLLLLSAVAGLAARALKTQGQVPDARSLWAANLVTALAFGLAHLPSWMAIGAVSVGLASIVLALNGVASLALGWIFTKRGILAAILAHAGADCAVQLIGPLTRAR
jgi:membrane protease YdiL (CAAX protease family)